MRGLPFGRIIRASLLAGGVLSITQPAVAAPVNSGPYNAAFLIGGIGIDRPLEGATIAAQAPATLSAWVRIAERQSGEVTLLALGDPAGAARALVLVDGRPGARAGQGAPVLAAAPLPGGQWVHVAGIFAGGQLRVLVDGQPRAVGIAPSLPLGATIHVAPVVAGHPHFGGELVGARYEDEALDAPTLAARVAARPDFAAIAMWHVGVGWEFQKTANTGYWRPQDPWTLPQARGPGTPPREVPVPTLPALTALAEGRWRINHWQLAFAAQVPEAGADLARPGHPGGSWYPATVPGTVLTTLVDRGVYPDPYYGLNNLHIPEDLARQDYWYRASFTVPAEAAGKRLSIVFNGVNYAASVFINGQDAGRMRGAFARGRFAFTAVAGENVLAVRVSPPPHPGTPHEQSIAAGAGENGGQLTIDGPTFADTEGWDWIPAIRDRDTGLWQDVHLEARGDVALGDPQVITDLPLPRTDSADVIITVPLRNMAGAPRQVRVVAAFDDVRVEKTVVAPPGDSELRLAPAEFAALHVLHPRLWWPNGYGDPALHRLQLTASVDGTVSDSHSTRFGIREVSYDLSLMDGHGALRRVNVQPTDGRLAGQKLIDVSHEAIKQSPQGWVESLTPAGETSPAVRDLGPEDTMPEPHLTLRINGVKIAARGGNWGMDDAMKRGGRARLEPYFRLHREAHLNIIRNWMGTDDEPDFYDLADENGMMVLNDFWQSTQNFQVEPEDPQLFLANAEDTVRRYRNHPSIVVWFGRNEGVPYPVLNEGLDDLLFRLDGTRWYTGSSNMVNLQGSGPYNYRPAAGYFTDLATGFSVETGTPSLATREAVEAVVPRADLWPISDTLAYHDWHFGGNGNTDTFMAALATRFGAPTSFDDFERKAQMMNLEDHKAIFEGFLGHLWTKNSGRLMWMSHPAWPSNMWQMYSSDYDTNAAYYGVAAANAPLHAQVNQPDNQVVVVNTTREDARGLTLVNRVLDLSAHELFTRTDRLDALANRDTDLAPLPLEPLFAQDPMVLVEQTLRDAQGAEVSRNLYWRGKDDAAYRALGTLAPVTLRVTPAAPAEEGGERVLSVDLANTSAVPALAAKLTLLDERGARILPAYYSDNYVSLLPGETRRITIRYPLSATARPHLAIRGWNVAERAIDAGR